MTRQALFLPGCCWIYTDIVQRPFHRLRWDIVLVKILCCGFCSVQSESQLVQLVSCWQELWLQGLLLKKNKELSKLNIPIIHERALDMSWQAGSAELAIIISYSTRTSGIIVSLTKYTQSLMLQKQDNLRPDVPLGRMQTLPGLKTTKIAYVIKYGYSQILCQSSYLNTNQNAFFRQTKAS